MYMIFVFLYTLCQDLLSCTRLTFPFPSFPCLHGSDIQYLKFLYEVLHKDTESSYQDLIGHSVNCFPLLAHITMRTFT